MTGPGLVVRQLGQDDDLEAEVELSHRAFGPMDDAGRARTLALAADSVAAGRLFGAFDGQQRVAAARYLDMRQWWHGRSMAMAGVSGVKVAPEQRGRGIGKALMTQLLGVIAGRGYPVSVLYPATAPIYRSLGWELAGAQYHAALPARSLGSLLLPDPVAAPPDGSAAPPGPLTAPPDGSAARLPASRLPASLRRAGPADAAAVIDVIGAVHDQARHCGPATRDIASVQRWLADPHLFSYLAPDAFLAYRWHGGDRDILVECAVAASAQVNRAMWAIVASHAPMAQRVRAQLPPDDAVGWLTREPDADLVRRTPWMLRVLDAPAAISARGFPAVAGLAVPVRLADPQLPANSGRWQLEVSGGRGTLNPCRTDNATEAGAVPPVSLGPRGFAAMFAGVPVPTLRGAGLVTGGDPGTDEALDCAFAGTPFLLDYF